LSKEKKESIFLLDMKTRTNIFLALAGLSLLAGCASKVTRAQAETLLTDFVAVTSASSYVLPTSFTTSKTYAQTKLKGTVSHSYDGASYYYHSKSDLTETTSSTEEKTSSETYVYVKDGACYHLEVSLLHYTMTTDKPEETFASLVKNLYDPLSVIDDCFHNVPDIALSRLQDFDAGSSKPLAESYRSGSSDSLEMMTELSVTSGGGSIKKKETLSFQKSRFYNREYIENTTEKVTDVYAWDMVSITYPSLTGWAQVKSL
jgi:hypothetical protein